MKIRKLTTASIKPYGRLIDSSCAREMPDGNGWGFVVRQRSKGWRIAYLILRSKKFTRLERHDSPETFEPVKGRAVIAVTLGSDPKRKNTHSRGLTPKFFLLDKPIVLKKGVWHALYTRTKESHIKIVENISLKSTYQKI